MPYISPILSVESSSKILFCIKHSSSDLHCCLLLSSIGSSFKDCKTSTCFCPWSSIVFVCFSKPFLKEE